MRIEAELRDVARHGGFFAVAVGEPAPGYRPIEACHAEGFADLVALTAHRMGTSDLRAAASLVHMSVASRLWSPAIACALAHGVVPDFAQVYRAGGSADLLLSGPTGEPSRDHRQSAQMLYRNVVERHLEPLAAGLRVKIAPGLLDGNAASAMVAATHAWCRARPDLSGPAIRLARTLLHTGRLSGTGTVQGDLVFRRSSCCLYYRVAGGAKCADCGI